MQSNHHTNRLELYLPSISFLFGMIFYVLVMAVENYLRPVGGAEIAQAIVALVLSIVAGSILKNKVSHSYLVAVSALFYTYALSMPVKAVADIVHYGLLALATALTTVMLFYLSNKFFKLKLNTAIKLAVAILGFIVVFISCANLATYILRLS